MRQVGPVFEHSPWIAEAVADQRPFGSVPALWEAMCAAVRRSPPERQTALIRAHPDLVGRAVLTAESQGEQAAAGLMDLTPEEAARFKRSTTPSTRHGIGFPFVICARLEDLADKKDAILAAFPAHAPAPHRGGGARRRPGGDLPDSPVLRLDDLIATIPPTI